MKWAESRRLWTGPGAKGNGSEGYLIGLLVFTVAYAFCFCSAIPAYVDEAYSFNLATDPNLPHMLSALRNGADGAFPLYPILVFGWEKLFGSSELSLRLSSGLFVLLFVGQSGRRLASYFGRSSAVLAILVVLADPLFIFYALQARFYGLVVFLFSLAFWSTWDLIQTSAVSGPQRVYHGLVCGLLCLSHPLASAYIAILGLLYLGFSNWLKTFSLSNAVAFLGGPLGLVIWLPAFLVQRQVNPVAPPGMNIPGLMKYGQYAFLNSPFLLALTLAGVAILFVGRLTARRVRGKATVQSGVPSRREEARGGHRFLALYAFAFIAALNGIVALLDAAHLIPIYLMSAFRYVLVCWVAFLIPIAGTWAGIARLIQRPGKDRWNQLAGRTQLVLVATGLLLAMEMRWSKWLVRRSGEQAYFANLCRTAKENRLGIVCESHHDAFYLATRTQAISVRYLLPDGFAFRKLMVQMAKYYPRPSPVQPEALRQDTNTYLFLGANREAAVVNPR